MKNEKHSLKKEDNAESFSVEKDKNTDSASLPVPNPFEKNHKDVSQETLDSVEQFKEAQTERD